MIRKLRVRTSMTHDDGSYSLFQGMEKIDDPILLARMMLDLPTREDQIVFPKRLRASSMGIECIREHVLGYRACLIYKKKVDIGLQVTYDIGNAIHSWLQNHSLYFGKRLVGWWECQSCGNMYWGRRRMTPCPKCNGSYKAYRYKEHTVKIDEPYLASGHQDMFWQLSPTDIRIGDLKTISANEYKTLTSPKPEHVLQVLTYIILSEYDKKLPVTLNSRFGFLFYISKQHHFRGLPFKAFVVDREKLNIEERFVRETLENFTRAINDETYLPPCKPSCVSNRFKNRVARFCPVRDACIEAEEAERSRK